ncbi:MAG: YdcF family protein [Desulfobacterales bacterium]|nr:YdcF family protein [Desulfobacterales bacterium]
MKNRRWKIALIVIMIACCLPVLELGYYLWMFSRPVEMPPNLETDAIIVFGESANRVAAGYDLARSLTTRYLIISSVLDGQLDVYDKRYQLPKGVKHITEPLARTTLENAVYVQKIIQRHRLSSIVLVTSAYHMPRSWALLKLCLAGSVANVRIYCAPTGKESHVTGYFNTKKGGKTLYNEMVRFWGSLGEWVVFKVRGELPRGNPKDIRLVKLLKSTVLFDI